MGRGRPGAPRPGEPGRMRRWVQRPGWPGRGLCASPQAPPRGGLAGRQPRLGRRTHRWGVGARGRVHKEGTPRFVGGAHPQDAARAQIAGRPTSPAASRRVRRTPHAARPQGAPPAFASWRLCVCSRGHAAVARAGAPRGSRTGRVAARPGAVCFAGYYHYSAPRSRDGRAARARRPFCPTRPLLGAGLHRSLAVPFSASPARPRALGVQRWVPSRCLWRGLYYARCI